jgi:hypothetical protein
MELYYSMGWNYKYGKFHSFIKDEFLPFFSKDDMCLLPLREFVARLINAPHDVTHVIAGPKIKPFLGWLKDQWRWDTNLFYGSTTPDKLHLWLQRATEQPRFVFWSDYSMFDSSHNEDTWEFVESFYSQYKHDVDFQRVLAAWRRPCGTLGDLKYQGRVMNASGRDDTALANAILNGVAMLLSVTAAWCKIPLEQVDKSHLLRMESELLLSVCGDDALGFLPVCDPLRARHFLHDCKLNLTAFGFSAKIFGSYRFEDAVYLGHRPLPINGVYYWSRTVGRCLYKLGWQSKPVGDPTAHMHGIMLMHKSCSLHVPVLSDIVRTWLLARSGTKVNPWTPDPNKPWETMGEVAPDHYADDTIQAFASAYSVEQNAFRGDLEQVRGAVTVTSSDVRDCIAHCVAVITEAKGRPCVLDHWLLRHMTLVDEQ